MTETKFVYVTFISTTPERLWEALTSPEFTKQYWFGMHQDSDWKPGSAWRLVFADGRVAAANGNSYVVSPHTSVSSHGPCAKRPPCKQ